MTFRSLFIGINSYRAKDISDLTCAAPDAQALYGLFGDTFGIGESTLLINEAATRGAIISEIKKLQAAHSDDVVVIGFSGHGSDSHHLVPHDADRQSLDSTAIHLDEITTLFSQIPARNLFLLLDCCFAGGAGAKVLHAPIAMRSENADVFEKISGHGRIIFTAANAKEAAIEIKILGHGLFTYYLIEAFRGAAEVVQANAIPVLGLISYVTSSVTARAKSYRHVQTPTLKGAVEGHFIFPILPPGKIFEGFFPTRKVAPVSEKVDDLSAFGFPQPILDAWKESIPSLNKLQLQAINQEGLFDGQHLVVSAPTSSGKTMIGELAMLYRHLRRERSYMLLPLRSLVNDKYEEFGRKYGPLGLRVIRSTGEISDDNDTLVRGKFDIALLTYERFAAMAVAMPHIMRQVGVIVIDEVQMIADQTRGVNLEFVLTLLKAQRQIGVEPQLIALSAVIGDTNGFETWLNARLLRTDVRPVPLEEGVIGMDGRFRFIAPDGAEASVDKYVAMTYRKGSSQDVIIPLVRQLVEAGEKVIVFRETKPIVRATANYLASNLGIPSATETLAMLPAGDPSSASTSLRTCLESGVGFHNADLDQLERVALEKSFRDPKSALKVLVATTTLAMGVNTPAWSVVIAGLTHPGDMPYSVAEYKNMVGRAGRQGYTPKGKSFLVASSYGEEAQYWRHYVRGHPEDLKSRFADHDPLLLVCRILATANAARVNGFTSTEIFDFINSSFAKHQNHEMLQESELLGALERLKAGGLVQLLEDRFVLTDLGRAAGELGVEVESVVRIARAFQGLEPREIDDRCLVAIAQATVELDKVLFPIHKKSIQERQRWRNGAAQQRLPSAIERELLSTDDVNATLRCKKLCATLMWLEGRELESLEASMMQHLPADSAAGPIRSTAERTRDMLGVIGRIGGLVVGTRHQDFSVNTDDLGVRLEMGIPPSLAWLSREVGRRLTRGEYLMLGKRSLTDAKTLAAAHDGELKVIFESAAKALLVKNAANAYLLSAQTKEDYPMPTPFNG